MERETGETRDTRYARELARADIGGHRIERLYVKARQEEEIRFSWWKDGRMQTGPLDLPEHELLPLFAAAIREGVFSKAFLRDLYSILNQLAASSDPRDDRLSEHSVAKLSHSVTLGDGRTLPAGSAGAIVGIWGEGKAYEVEFLEPFHAVVTVPADALSAGELR